MKNFSLRFWIPVVLLIFATVKTQQFYVVRSEALTPGAFTEFPFVSSTRLIDFLERRKGTWADTVFSDTLSYSAAPIQGYYINPSRIIFLSADWYDGTSDPRFDCHLDPCVFIASAKRMDYFARIRKIRDSTFFRHAAFDVSRTGEKPKLDYFRYDRRGVDTRLTANTQFIEQIRESMLNGWGKPPAMGNIYRVKYSTAIKNHLVFVSGSMSSVYGLYMKKIGLFAVESDPFYKNGVMAALGQYMLLRAIGPSRHVRVELSISASFEGSRYDQLPRSVAIGVAREPFRLIGHGSARVFSAEVTPLPIDGMRFVGLNLGRKPNLLPQPPRTGIMQLYGRNVVLDSRHVSVFARDISLVPEHLYMTMHPPSNVKSFPADLANPALQYSGVYEDGWISDRAYFILKPVAPNSKLFVRALIPAGRTPLTRVRVCVRLDTALPRCSVQRPGTFSMEQEVASAARHTVEIDISNPQRLSAADPRLLGAKLDFVGFTL